MKPSSLIGHVLELFEQIDKNTKSIDRLVSDFSHNRRYIGSRDRRFISDTVYGMVRHRRFMEALLEHWIAEHPSTAQVDQTPERYLPIYIAFGIGVQSVPVEQMVDNVRSRWEILFPSIDCQQFGGWIAQHTSLDFLPNDDIVRLGVQYSFQDWMVRAWKQQFGDEVVHLMKALNQPAPTTLRVNLLKTTREQCIQRLKDEQLEAEPTQYSSAGLVTKKRFQVSAIQAFKDGWFEVQDEGSQIVSLIANPRPGDFVIDACAGAGGKTLHMAEMMNNEGEIIAIDVERDRLRELKTRAERAGVKCVRTFLRDEHQSEQFHNTADLVLVDAPCSGTGTIRRNPGTKWTVTETLVDHYAELQLKILTESARFVKRDGKLIYSTCSLIKKENTDVLSLFLDMNPEFYAVKDKVWMEKLQIDTEESFITLLPHRHSTDGFFISVLMRHN